MERKVPSWSWNNGPALFPHILKHATIASMGQSLLNDRPNSDSLSEWVKTCYILWFYFHSHEAWQWVTIQSNLLQWQVNSSIKILPGWSCQCAHIPMNQIPLSNISGMVRLVVDSSSNSSSLRIATTTAGQNELKHANACGVLSDTLWMIALWDEAIMLFLVPLLFLRWWIKDKTLYFLHEVCRYQCLKL